jgi:hypothetical protein
MRTAILLLGALAVVAFPALAYAADSIPTPGEGKAIGLSDIRTLIEGVLNFLIYFASIAMTGFIIVAGLRMVMSRGDAAKFGDAKKMLYNALIGAAVILGVGLILNTIANFAQDPTGILR